MMHVLSGAGVQPELQLQRELVEFAQSKIRAQATRRGAIRTREAWESMREELLSVVRGAFHKRIFARENPLNVRVVSSFERSQFRVENVLFESLPGWEVNASVYLPRKPGVYPPVICPTGHSTKTRDIYQRAAQVFAMSGYIACSFDPPGQAGELAYLNDHFTNGLIGYLTGFWSNNHFIIDALRCIDYLETRKDVDHNAAISITGVSGGGKTSLYAALLDDRIDFLAPVCCIAERELVHLTELYTACPEQLEPGYLAAGVDYIDMLALWAPKPALVVAGKQDELWDYRSVSRLYNEVQRVYSLYDEDDAIELFIQEDSGHDYTVAMANEVVERMNRMNGIDRKAKRITDEDIDLVDPEMLLCRPSTDVNMFTTNRDEGRRLASSRELPDEEEDRIGTLREAVRQTLGIDPDEYHEYSVREEPDPPVRWAHRLQKIDIRTGTGAHVPGLLYRRETTTDDGGRVPSTRKRPGLLAIDDRGKWHGFAHNGYLARTGRFVEREDYDSEPLILSIDVSGVGELAPEPVAYDMAGWNDIERILSYVGVSSRKPIMGLRVRDALYALDYLRGRADVDENRIIIAGRGVGAICALLAAVFSESLSILMLVDMLGSYQLMTESFPFRWPQSIVIPDVLTRYDLPELLASVHAEHISVINPRDAGFQVIDTVEGERIYADAPESVSVEIGLEDTAAMKAFVETVLNTSGVDR